METGKLYPMLQVAWLHDLRAVNAGRCVLCNAPQAALLGNAGLSLCIFCGEEGKTQISWEPGSHSSCQMEPNEMGVVEAIRFVENAVKMTDTMALRFTLRGTDGIWYSIYLRGEPENDFPMSSNEV